MTNPILAAMTDFEFTSHIGMCGGGGISFKKEAYSVLVDDDGEEYWVFFDIEEPDSGYSGYIWSLWLHHTGYKATAIIGGGREQELKGLAFKALDASVRGDWTSAKDIVGSWDNNA